MCKNAYVTSARDTRRISGWWNVRMPYSPRPVMSLISWIITCPIVLSQCFWILKKIYNQFKFKKKNSLCKYVCVLAEMRDIFYRFISLSHLANCSTFGVVILWNKFDNIKVLFIQTIIFQNGFTNLDKLDSILRPHELDCYRRASDKSPGGK